MEKALHDLNAIADHLESNEQIFVSRWIKKCVVIIKEHTNERV
jgi:hypothetical protein